MSDSLMIEVANLTKRYAGHTAVSDISFSVGRGEIVGLLGPNGAGKSTTMRILSCFLPATSGTVRVAGYDVFRESREVRRRIGFMPENNPLHLDMRVREYLKFRARLKGLGWRRSRERVGVVMEQCGLTDVSRKIVGQLSKGYKQRVGLADALVHEPELIILDEPTIGLDPHQIRSVRQLIKSLAHQHTVLISTHILPEAEMTCNRMLIMYQGKVLASDTPENLQRFMSSKSQVIAELRFPKWSNSMSPPLKAITSAVRSRRAMEWTCGLTSLNSRASVAGAFVNSRATATRWKTSTSRSPARPRRKKPDEPVGKTFTIQHSTLNAQSSRSARISFGVEC
jgi:ABC-2 type transport system ATP-binding protein